MTAAYPRINPQALAQWHRDGKWLDTPIGAAFYRDTTPHGDDLRPWLLLIHGFPSASIDWWPLWPTLSQHFHLLAPDLLGFGFSPKPVAVDYTIALRIG